MVEPQSYGLPTMGMRQWWSCYCGEKTSTPASQTMMVEHQSCVLSRMDMRQWWSCYRHAKVANPARTNISCLTSLSRCYPRVLLCAKIQSNETFALYSS